MSLINNQIRFRVSALVENVIQHGVRNIHQSLDLLKSPEQKQKIMKHLLNNGARVEDTNDYFATFHHCTLMFGKQKGHGLSRQETEF
jgi:LytS/YehU family sensor histidine kinase